jgi:hypothetical protein
VTSYYDLSAANTRIKELRPLLETLRADRDAVAEKQKRLERLREPSANGKHQSELTEQRDEMAVIIRRMEAAVQQVDGWGITLRDIGTSLVDFPALANGRPVWLCWKLGEDDIAWWHELDTGIAGRKPLIELE